MVISENQVCVKKAISKMLKSVVVIFETGDFKFFLQKSRMPILAINSPALDLVKILPANGLLILNFDEAITKEIKKESKARVLTYGFLEGADFSASDINFSYEGANFKISHQGNIVPFWLKNVSKKEQISDFLIAVCVGTAQGINLVKISQIFKNKK